MIKYMSFFVIMLVLGMLYERYERKFNASDASREHDLIQKYLLNGGTGLVGKPILWIHIKHSVNQRWWPSFHSRNTRRLNQPYILSCIKSAVRHCSESFNICLIDDNSFGKLIPGWKINLEKLADPIKCHVRTLALSKLLYYFGGMLLPSSTAVMKDLKPMHDIALASRECFTAETVNRAVTAESMELFPDVSFLGCKRHSPVMKRIISFLKTLNSTDYTSESDFLGQANRYLYKECKDKQMTLVGGATIGTRTASGTPVMLEDLMGNSFMELDDEKLVALYIPAREVLNRKRWQWFARLSEIQLRDCNNMAAKYLLIAQG